MKTLGDHINCCGFAFDNLTDEGAAAWREHQREYHPTLEDTRSPVHELIANEPKTKP